jgi:hypothetical protein
MGGIRKAPLFTTASLWIEVASDGEAAFEEYGIPVKLSRCCARPPVRFGYLLVCSVIHLLTKLAEILTGFERIDFS